MHYKTIVLELIQDHPALHEQLRASRTLLSTVERTAAALKSRHDFWMREIGQARPENDPSSISSEALELALQELQDNLPSDSSASDAEALSLDAAMAHLLSHTPTA